MNNKLNKIEDNIGKFIEDSFVISYFVSFSIKY